jgi:Tfp pilus assembly protein PilE
MPGVQGPNRFGNPPPPNTLGAILLALVLPLIAIIGIIAAIAIPAYMDYVERAREAAPNSAPLQQ